MSLEKFLPDCASLPLYGLFTASLRSLALLKSGMKFGVGSQISHQTSRLKSASPVHLQRSSAGAGHVTIMRFSVQGWLNPS